MMRMQRLLALTKSAVQIKYKEKYDVTLSDSDHEEIKKFVVQDLSDSPLPYSLKIIVGTKSSYSFKGRS